MKETGFTLKDGRRWFVDGWKLFTKKPLLLILGAIIWMLLEVGLALIPVAGEIMDGLLFPVLYAGFLYGIRELDEQRTLKISHFFQGFTDKTKIFPLLVLGLMMVAYEVLEAGLAMILGPFPAIVLAAPLGILIISSLLYSVPLVMFNDSKPVNAIKSSYNSCGQHISALISIYLILLVFAVLSVVTFGLALLVFLPVTFCAFYLSYKDIYT